MRLPLISQTVTDDPRFLYQDVVVALTHDRPINNGQPTLHAACLASLEVKPGETSVHVGAGSGYYTAILARLVGPQGSAVAFETETDLARRAAANLADLPQVTVECRSGAQAPLPQCDILYVNAGATDPLDVWLDALKPGGGRLLFPLTPAEGFGGMLLVTRTGDQTYSARFLTAAVFIPCVGARDDDTAERLGAVFREKKLDTVRTLHRDSKPGPNSWFAGRTWWLGT